MEETENVKGIQQEVTKEDIIYTNYLFLEYYKLYNRVTV